MAVFQIAVVVLLVVPIVIGSNVCSFHYNVPKTAGSCETIGGVDQDLEDKVSRLTGSSEGLKVISEANLAMTKELRTTANYAQQTQRKATQQLDSIATEIRSLKALLNVVYDEPVNAFDDMGEVENEDVRSYKANPRDPNKLLRQALQEAEMKVRNMTSFMTENARRQSITRTSMEMRIQQQQIRLQRAMNKLDSLEQQALRLSGHPRVASPFFNNANQEFTDLVTMAIETSAAVGARKLVAIARNDDITAKISNILLPLTMEDRELNQIHADTLSLTISVDNYENDTSDLEYEIKTLNTKWSGNFLTILTKIPTFQQKVRSFERQVLNFAKNISTVSNTISQEETELNNIKNKLDQIAQDITGSLANINRTQQQVQNLDKLPIVALAEVEENAKAEIQREINVVKQLQQAVAGIQSILSTLPTPKPTGNHPRRRSITPWQKSVLYKE
ncbi:hypothetical protein KP79_PYT15214 [Mizuhopecten yessoensis]|uniref:Uncharacterized protein n=1 Tax=Mizuhopecten yessoensis TaxID=6573 RepID=A0A210QZF9_MIZYE|nr:hypothetical protein KP79_PYT15214 [Mizuhopecten yessoensis]